MSPQPFSERIQAISVEGFNGRNRQTRCDELLSPLEVDSPWGTAGFAHKWKGSSRVHGRIHRDNGLRGLSYSPHWDRSGFIRFCRGRREAQPRTLREAQRFSQPPANAASCPILFMYRVIYATYHLPRSTCWMLFNLLNFRPNSYAL